MFDLVSMSKKIKGSEERIYGDVKLSGITGEKLKLYSSSNDSYIRYSVSYTAHFHPALVH